MSAPLPAIRRIAAETLVCGGLLFALLLIVFGQAAFELAGGGTPGMFDIKHYYVPMAFLLDTALHSDEVPQWNPLTFCGTPFAANPQSAALYPPNVVRSLLTTPSPLSAYYGLIALAVLQTIAAGVGVYWFARDHALGYVASFTAAGTFIFSMAYTARLAELHFVSALVWIPFALLAFRKLLRAERRSKRVFWALGCGVLIGGSLLSGFLQLQVYVGVLFAVYWLLDRIAVSRWANYRGAGSYPTRIGADLLYCGVIVLVAGGIAAALLLPAAEFAQYTYRAGSGEAGSADYGLSWTDIKEGLFGASDASNQFAFAGSVLSAYLLGFLGLFGARKRATWVYFLLFLALLDCSIGPPFPVAKFVDLISPFQIAQPERAFMLACLPLGVLVGFGIEFLRTRFDAAGRRAAITAVAAIACTTLYFLSGLPLTNSAALLLLALTGIVVLNTWRRVARLALPLACGILIAETVVVNHVELPELFERSGAIDVRKMSGEPRASWESNTRVTDLAPNGNLYLLQPSINGYDPLYLGYVWKLVAPWHYNWNYKRILQAHDTVEDNPYPFLFMKRPFWLVRQYVAGPLPHDDPLFPPTTTAFVESDAALSIPRIEVDEVVGEGVSAYRSLDLGTPQRLETVQLGGGSQQRAWKLPLPERDSHHSVMRLRFSVQCSGMLHVYVDEPRWVDPLPVYFATIDEESIGEVRLDVPLPDNFGEAVRFTWMPKPGECDLEWLGATLLIDGDDEDGLVEIDRRTFNSVRVALHDLPGPRVLAFIDAKYPGWSVTVDDQPAPVLTVDTAFKGVEVAAGSHVVEFRFASATFQRGLFISIFATAVVLLGVIAAFYRSRIAR